VPGVNYVVGRLSNRRQTRRRDGHAAHRGHEPAEAGRCPVDPSRPAGGHA
jgi:hypothetical protein